MNVSRWDYIFSIIKRLQNKADCVLPERKMVRFRLQFPILVIKYAQEVDDPVGAVGLIINLKPKVVER